MLSSLTLVTSHQTPEWGSSLALTRDIGLTNEMAPACDGAGVLGIQQHL